MALHAGPDLVPGYAGDPDDRVRGGLQPSRLRLPGCHSGHSAKSMATVMALRERCWHTLTITALGDQQVNNYGYSGPNRDCAPYNQKTVTRHYGFGATQGTGRVTIGGSQGSGRIVGPTPPSCHGAEPQHRSSPTCTIATAHEPGERRKLCPLRTAGHHSRQRQAIGRYHHRYDWRQSSDLCQRWPVDPVRDRSRHRWRPASSFARAPTMNC